MIEAAISSFAERVASSLSQELESIIFYPHPFHQGGLVIVLKDEVRSVIDFVSKVYQCDPPAIPLHCLRRSELFELSLPGQFLMPHLFNEQLHLPYWLKHKSTVLYGCDPRGEINPPTSLTLLLDNHLEACMQYLRTHHVISKLITKDHLKLLEELDRQFRALMATALLLCGVWEVSPATLPERFKESYGDTRMLSLWEQFGALKQQSNDSDEAGCRQAALESVWLFECFLRLLRKTTR